MDISDKPATRRRGTKRKSPNLGDRLKTARLQKGLSQAQLASKVGATQSVIQKIETGKSQRPRKLDRIARALDVSPVWLMFGTVPVEALDGETVRFAMAWAKLKEPYREAMKQAILTMAARSKRC
jgi:transcriptional regulator with XRE-family HTH domain